jgi:glutaconyl-CoA decarboxylase
MKKTIRFKIEGETFSVSVEKRGDELLVERGEEAYTVNLLPDDPVVAASELPVGPVPAHPAATAPAATAAPAADTGGSSSTGPTGSSDPAAGSPGTAGARSGQDALSAPMAGIIKKIPVRVGQTVEAGQVVLIMEAMKMDIDVQAEHDGIVAEVAVKQGDTVSAGQSLMIIH